MTGRMTINARGIAKDNTRGLRAYLSAGSASDVTKKFPGSFAEATGRSSRRLTDPIPARTTFLHVCAPTPKSPRVTLRAFNVPKNRDGCSKRSAHALGGGASFSSPPIRRQCIPQTVRGHSLTCCTHKSRPLVSSLKIDQLHSTEIIFKGQPKHRL
eukprot:5831203-Pyramimonas_sp.AAC.2